MSPIEAHSELSVIQRLFRLLRDERAVFPLWQQLVVTFEVKGKKAHDARLAAAMQRHAVTHLLTFNTSDFARYPHLTAQSPTSVLANAGAY